MQILDVNNNLLKVLSIQDAQKAPINMENESFADVLSLVDNNVVSVNDVQSPEEKNIVHKVSKKANKPLDKDVNYREDDAVKTDKVAKKENNKANNKKDNSQKADASDNAENVDSQQSSKTENNVQNPTQDESEDTSVASQITSNDVADVSGLLAINNDGPVLQIATVNTEVSDELVVVSNVDLDTSGIMQNIVENNSSAQKTATTSQNASVDMSAGQIDQNNIVPISEVSQQEEKIAELLPEGENIEIKVSVKEDKVVATPKKTEVVVLQDADSESKINIDTIDGINVGNKKQEVTSNFVAPVTQAQVNENSEVVSFVNTDSDVSVYTPKDASVQAQAITSVVNDKIVKNTTEVDSFKDIYNKGITKEVSEQIKVNITQSAIKGVDKIEIQLKPADLGQVEIKLHIGKGGHLQAHIVASNPETLEILQKDFESLKNAFNSAGYQTDDNSFSFSYQGEDQSNNEREKLRDFIGDVISQDIAVEIAANEYISNDSVNIRV